MWEHLVNGELCLGGPGRLLPGGKVIFSLLELKPEDVATLHREHHDALLRLFVYPPVPGDVELTCQPTKVGEPAHPADPAGGRGTARLRHGQARSGWREPWSAHALGPGEAQRAGR